MLWRAHAVLAAQRCPCGCGHWSDEAHDPDSADGWQVEMVECFARKASHDFVRTEKPPAHALIRVSRVTDDAELAFDPSRAAAIHAAHFAKYPTTAGTEAP